MKTGPKLRIVCDTNVLLSMLAFPGRHLDGLWEIIQTGAVELFLSEFILKELARNLTAKGLLPDGDAQEAVTLLRGRATILDPKPHVHVVKRKDSDNRILECALEARAAVLVTGDLRDLRPLGHFQGAEILTPREFLHKYFPEA